MATYTITIDERTKSGKQVLNYLKSHGVIEIPNETTRKAIQEIREGKGIRCKTIEEFIESLKLPAKNKDHALKGEYAGCRECHIKPDWLLIYDKSTDGELHILNLIRTGTHSDLFKK